MFLSIDNPVYNTIIVFCIIMILVYILKPDVIYDSNKKEFRQFGTTDGKTLMPIYVIGILIAMLLYIFFYYLSTYKKNVSSTNTNISDIRHLSKEDQYYAQQQQINYLQTQLNQVIQQQINNNMSLMQKNIKLMNS